MGEFVNQFTWWQFLAILVFIVFMQPLWLMIAGWTLAAITGIMIGIVSVLYMMCRFVKSSFLWIFRIKPRKEYSIHEQDT